MNDTLCFTRALPPQPVGIEAATREVGGQWDWCWAIPAPYRVLAAPNAWLPMPAAPRPNEDFMRSLGYWACLQSFLTFSFAWTRHDRGLLWWYGEGMPVEDPRFRLLRDVWHADGMLERYLEWVIDGHHVSEPLRGHALAIDELPVRLSAEWNRRVEVVRQEDLTDSTVGRTPHGKHLEGGGHIAGPAMRVENSDSVLFRSSSGALLSVSSVPGWYADLTRLGNAAQGMARTSVRVDVLVKPIGFMGTFRRSRTTGLWFTGARRYHSVGN